MSLGLQVEQHYDSQWDLSVMTLAVHIMTSLFQACSYSTMSQTFQSLT
jgi:hypothetical protein